MNMKKKQNHGAKLCLKLVLNKLKEMKGCIYIYTPLEILLKGTSKQASMCASNKKTF
jgi:hypothetical protein